MGHFGGNTLMRSETTRSITRCVVYRTGYTKLSRSVALKFLPVGELRPQFGSGQIRGSALHLPVPFESPR
jgi:hypothetical protein